MYKISYGGKTLTEARVFGNALYLFYGIGASFVIQYGTIVQYFNHRDTLSLYT